MGVMTAWIVALIAFAIGLAIGLMARRDRSSEIGELQARHRRAERALEQVTRTAQVDREAATRSEQAMRAERRRFDALAGAFDVSAAEARRRLDEGEDVLALLPTRPDPPHDPSQDEPVLDLRDDPVADPAGGVASVAEAAGSTDPIPVDGVVPRLRDRIGHLEARVREYEATADSMEHELTVRRHLDEHLGDVVARLSLAAADARRVAAELRASGATVDVD